MDARTIQQTLINNGFPCGKGGVDGVIGHDTKMAVTAFQYAYAFSNLDVDGDPGDDTQRALVQLPHLSPHFTVEEVRSRGNKTCYVRRELLRALEVLRAHINGPLPIIDAYRDPLHNRSVGGAQTSMHPFGLAADLPASLGLTVSFVQSLQLFSGIGDKNGIVLHVDCRHNAGSNNLTPWATPQRPARWRY